MSPLLQPCNMLNISKIWLRWQGGNKKSKKKEGRGRIVIAIQDVLGQQVLFGENVGVGGLALYDVGSFHERQGLYVDDAR